MSTKKLPVLLITSDSAPFSVAARFLGRISLLSWVPSSDGISPVPSMGHLDNVLINKITSYYATTDRSGPRGPTIAGGGK